MFNVALNFLLFAHWQFLLCTRNTCIKKSNGWVPTAHTYNPSHSGGRDQEDCGSKQSLGK
jgi:hypothetical protein